MPLIIVNGKTKNVTWAEFYAQQGGKPPPAPDQGTLGTQITPSGTGGGGTNNIVLGTNAPNIPAPIVPTISAGSNTQQKIQQQAFQQLGGTGTLGLGQPASLRPNIPPEALSAASGVRALVGGVLGAPVGFAAGITGGIQAGLDPGQVIQAGFTGAGQGIKQLGQAAADLGPPPSPIRFGDPLDLGPQPNTITGTGPSPIQLGNPAQTLGDLNNTGIFPPGTQFSTATSSAGGTSTAVLPDGRIVDLTRVETYGQLVAESLLRAIATGNMDLRSTNIREEWAMSFKHLWEDEFENVREFLTFYGYRQVPGTNNWIRMNISDPGSPSFGGGGQLPPVVFRTARGGGGGGGFGGGTAARGRVSGLGLVNWRI